MPSKIFLHPYKHPESKNSQYTKTNTPGMQKRTFHLDVWGTKHLECSKNSIFLRLDCCFFPNFISVECVYSHSGLKERKFEEKTFPQDSTAFSIQSNYILNIIVIWLKSLPPCVVWMGSQSLSYSERCFLGREQSKVFFSAGCPPSCKRLNSADGGTVISYLSC